MQFILKHWENHSSLWKNEAKVASTITLWLKKKRAGWIKLFFFTAIDEVIGGVLLIQCFDFLFPFFLTTVQPHPLQALPSMKRDEDAPFTKHQYLNLPKSQYYVNYVQVLHSSPTWTKRKSIKCLSLSQLSWKTILLKLDHLQGSGWRIIE